MFKIASLLVVGLVVAAIAYQVVGRVSSDTLNIALGVACGAAATIPITLGLVFVLWRRRGSDQGDILEQPEPAYARQPAPAMPQRIPYAPPVQQPQIIVIAPPQGTLAPGNVPPELYNVLPQNWFQSGTSDPNDTVDARDWRIIGE